MKSHIGSAPYIVYLTAVALWCGMLLFVPFLTSIEHQSHTLSQSLYQAYSHICHQYESRSVFIYGHKLPVCARCTGIYSGYFIGSIAIFCLKRKWYARGFIPWFVIALPMIIDVFLNSTGLHASTICTRMSTGMIFGAGAAVILSWTIIEGINELISHPLFMKGVPHESKT